MALKIKEFPKSSNFWRVDAVTRIKKNPNIDSEPIAQVLCSEIIDTSVDPFLQSNRTQKTMSLWVGVGQLAKIRSGSIWQDKKCIQIPSNDKSYITEQQFKIDTNQVIKTRWNQPVTINNRTFYPIPFKALNVGENFDLIKHTVLYIAPCEGTSTVLIIPSFVILSSYYLSSSKIARAIFANNRDQLIVDNESEVLKNGSIKLVLRKNCDDADMHCLARWKASHVMNDEISSMFKRIQAHNINTTGLNTSSQTDGAILDVSFPFKGTTTLNVIGKFIVLEEANETLGKKRQWGFLVLAINECTHPYPYNEIHHQRHNDNEQIDGSTPTNTAWSGTSSGGGSSEDEDDEDNDPEVGSDDNTNNNPTINIILSGTKFPDLNNKTLVKIRKTTQTSQSDKSKSDEEQTETNQYGTGEPTDQNTSSNPLNIQQNNNPEAPRINIPSDILNFFKAIDTIRMTKGDKGWLLNSITYENRGWKINTQNGTDKLSAFPVKIKGCVSWHLMFKNKLDYTKSIPRAVAIIQVSINQSKTVYLLEMERKAETDAHCLLIIRNQNYSIIESHIMKAFLRSTARNNRWSLNFNNLYFKKIEHRYKTIKDFADNIIDSISSI